MLVEDGLLERGEVDGVNWCDDAGRVDYEKIYLNRFRVLEAAKRRGYERDRAAVDASLRSTKAGYMNMRCLWRSSGISA